jgi:hypothetical protein
MAFGVFGNPSVIYAGKRAATPAPEPAAANPPPSTPGAGPVTLVDLLLRLEASVAKLEELLSVGAPVQR